MRFGNPWTMAAALVCLAAAPVCAQTTLTFDDLGPSLGGAPVPDGYAGHRWTGTNWHYLSTLAAPANTFLALSGSATMIRRVDGAAFFVDSVDLWSRRGLDARGDTYFVLYYKGQTVYNGKALKQKVRFTGVPTAFRSPYAGPVDGIAFAFDKPGRGGDWDHLAFDNLRVRPAP